MPNDDEKGGTPGHTPGEWRMEAAGLSGCVRIFGPGGELVAHAWSVEGDDASDGVMKANAKLITASPALLAAARHVLALLLHPERSVSALDAAKLESAINRALGKE